MKKNNSSFSLIGFVLFFLPLSISISLGIFIYSLLASKFENFGIIFVFLFLYVIMITIIFSLIDIYRRRQMIDKPVEQILNATQKIAVGNFDVKLSPLHQYNKYDQYDKIMDNINKMAKELSKSEILKNDFISNVSHEIKTPLAIILNYAKMLSQDNLDNQTKQKYIKNLTDASQKLSNLVSNILKLNKLENQSIQENKQNINLSEQLRQSILQFENLIEQKNLNLILEIDEISCKTDSTYWEIIFNNLISNAIKFTENSGTIVIKLVLAKQNIIFSVKDTGCGISNEIGQHIFEKFYQGDTSHSHEGNGLGLALVKKIIDIMGGEISIESEPNVGSTFTVKTKKEKQNEQ